MGWKETGPLRLAFRAREGVVRWWRTRPPPPACVSSKGGVGVVGDRDGPSDSRFERGRGRVVAGVEKLHKELVVGKY